MKSIFTDKQSTPTPEELKVGIGATYAQWIELTNYVLEKNPGATTAWHFSGDKFGWSFRISDAKRVLIYLLPRNGFFKAAFVFGHKATGKIIESDVSDAIKTTLRDAKQYAEGRGIRLDVYNESMIADLKKLIDFKLEK